MDIFSSLQTAGTKALRAGSDMMVRLSRNSATAYQTIAGFGTCGASLPTYNAVAAMRHFDHWAYAAMMLNANAVANVPLRLYARVKRDKKQWFGYKSFSEFSAEQKAHLSGRLDGGPSRAVRRKVAEFGEDLVEVVDDHPALRVLDQVNEYQNGYELSVLRMLDLQLAGDSYLYPLRAGVFGEVVEVLRLPPRYVTVGPGEGKRFVKYTFNGIEQTDIPPEKIIHFKIPDPDNIFTGRGWVQAAWSALGLHGAKRTMDLAVFQNMARPDYLVSVKAGGNPNALKEFKKDVNENNRGARKAGKFLTISGDVGVTQLNWKFDEQGTPTRIIEEISAVSGVPVAMLLSNDPTKSTSTVARLGWYRNTVRPLCRLDEEKLNEKWLPLFDGSEDLFICYDTVSFEDLDAISRRMCAEVAGGLRKVNEGRSELGLPPDESGDILYPPSGSTSGGRPVGAEESEEAAAEKRIANGNGSKHVSRLSN